MRLPSSTKLAHTRATYRSTLPRIASSSFAAFSYHDLITAGKTFGNQQFTMTTAAAGPREASNGVKSPVPPITASILQKGLPSSNGDLNNTAVIRAVPKPERRTEFAYESLSIPEPADEPMVRSKYRPFLLSDTVQQQDWVSKLELATATELAYNDMKITGERIKVLVLYGSLRQR